MAYNTKLQRSQEGVENIPKAECPQHLRRLPGKGRRIQLIRIAEALFARTGLHGTTTQALAKAAGITEPILYAHFSSKDGLYRAAVESNIEARLRALGDRLESCGKKGSPFDLVECLAIETVGVCVARDSNATLTTWALLEAPQYAADLYRNEIGAVEMMWERELNRRLQASPWSVPFSLHFIPLAVNACLAYGFWLAALRHTPSTSEELACQFATGLAQMAFSEKQNEGKDKQDRAASYQTEAYPRRN